MRFLLLAAMLMTEAPALTEPTAASPSSDAPAKSSLSDIVAKLDAGGRVELDRLGLVIERDTFTFEGETVEAVITRPSGAERSPGLVLVAGHMRSATDLLPQAVRFARAGFASIAVSQPGYGRSTGTADFAGPRTFAALHSATERFASRPFVDPERLGIYGYSRGALAAAELAARTDFFKASVLGGGIYDFRSAYEQIGLAGIKGNMDAEAGKSAEALAFRSPINDMAGLDGPVLIIHGEEDANAPLAQAKALDAKLTALQRDHQLLIIPAADHGLSMDAIIGPATRFFSEQLLKKP